MFIKHHGFCSCIYSPLVKTIVVISIFYTRYEMFCKNGLLIRAIFINIGIFRILQIKITYRVKNILKLI
jgi:hypothetical protein